MAPPPAVYALVALLVVAIVVTIALVIHFSKAAPTPAPTPAPSGGGGGGGGGGFTINNYLPTNGIYLFNGDVPVTKTFGSMNGLTSYTNVVLDGESNWTVGAMITAGTSTTYNVTSASAAAIPSTSFDTITIDYDGGVTFSTGTPGSSTPLQTADSSTTALPVGTYTYFVQNNDQSNSMSLYNITNGPSNAIAFPTTPPSMATNTNGFVTITQNNTSKWQTGQAIGAGADAENITYTYWCPNDSTPTACPIPSVTSFSNITLNNGQIVLE